MLIDSIMGTIDHIYCDNTFHVITEQNHRRNTIVRRPVMMETKNQAYFLSLLTHQTQWAKLRT